MVAEESRLVLEGRVPLSCCRDRSSYISILMPSLYACVRVYAQNIYMCLYKLASTTNKTRRSFLEQGDTVTVTMERECERCHDCCVATQGCLVLSTRKAGGTRTANCMCIRNRNTVALAESWGSSVGNTLGVLISSHV